MRGRIVILIVLSLLLTLLYVQGINVPDVEASPIYQGDLVLTGNNVTIIEGRFDINGSISVEGNATLILQNAYLNWSQNKYYSRYINFWKPANGNPRLVAYNSTITRYYTNELSFYHNSTAVINNSTINCQVDTSSSSPISISNNSDISETIYAREFSVIDVANSKIGTLHDQNIDGQINDSQINLIYMRPTSVDCNISNLESGIVDHWDFLNNCSVTVLSGGSTTNLTLTNTNVNEWNFDFYGNSNSTISNSNIDRLYVRDSSAIYCKSIINDYIYAGDSSWVFIENSDFTEIRPYDSSTWWLLNSTYTRIYPRLSYSGKLYVSWYFDVYVVDSFDQAVPSASVTVTFPNSTVVDSKLADANGFARFSLMEKIVNASDVDYYPGEYPVGEYGVEAFYESYSETASANLTETKQVVIRLEDYTIPEEPTSEEPSEPPSEHPSEEPTSEGPTEQPTEHPSEEPSEQISEEPTEQPTTEQQSEEPTEQPSGETFALDFTTTAVVAAGGVIGAALGVYWVIRRRK